MKTALVATAFFILNPISSSMVAHAAIQSIPGYRCEIYQALDYDSGDLYTVAYTNEVNLERAIQLCEQFMRDNLPGQEGYRNWELIWEESIPAFSIEATILRASGYSCDVYDALYYTSADRVATFYTSTNNRSEAIRWCQNKLEQTLPGLAGERNWQLNWEDELPLEWYLSR